MSDLNKLTVAALKEKCIAAGLDTSGKKAELVARLLKVLPTQEKEGEMEVKPAKKSTRTKKVTKVAYVDDDDVDDDEEEEEEVPNKAKGKRKSPKSEDAGNGTNEDGDNVPKKAKKAASQTRDYGTLEDSSYPFGPAAKGIFKIASWNVNGLRSLLKGDRLFPAYIRKESADVICVQETKLQDRDEGSLSEADLAGDLYPYRFFHSSVAKKGYAGTALLSKVKPLSVTYGVGNTKLDQEGRVITAEFEKFYLVTSYTVNSGQNLERLTYRTTEWDVAFLDYLLSLDKVKPVVWTGDLNVSHKEIDIADPKGNKRTAGFTQEERDSFSKILDSGFADTFRQLHPDKPNCYTWWSYRTNAKSINKGWRLDYYIVSNRFMPAVQDSFIRGSVDGSDHCPVGLALKLD